MGSIELLIVATRVLVLAVLVAIVRHKGMTLAQKLVWFLVVVVFNALGATVWIAYAWTKSRRTALRAY